MAVDPVTAVANAISEIAAAIKLAFSGENRKLLADVKRVKRMKKSIDIAEDIFFITDAMCLPKEEYEGYWKKRKRFEKFD